MEYRRLGKTGIKVSELSYGSWVTFGPQIDVDMAIESMDFAYNKGVNFFDNAQIYAGGQAETIMGSALKELGWNRESYIISSKFYFGILDGVNTQETLNRKFLLEAVPKSLERLQLDYLDIAYCHRYDEETEIEEIVWAMSDIVDRGLALYWGTSEWPVEKIIQAYEFAKENGLRAPVVEQPQYNLIHRQKMEKDYLPVFEKYGMGTTTWSPLQSGILTGKYNDDKNAHGRLNLEGYEWLKENLLVDEKLEIVKELEVIAKDLDVPLSQLAIAWCLKNKNVSTVIIGASTNSQWKQNFDSLEVVPLLDDEVMSRIHSIIKNYWGYDTP